MLRAFLDSPGKISLREIKTPEPKNGELLIKIKSSLTCGTDLKAFLRGHPVIPMPGPFGHEFSGVVEKAGAGAPFKEGDGVMAVHSAPCLKCPYCKKGLHNLCLNIMDTKVIGAFSEYILLPRHIVKQNVYIKPKKLSFGEAAFLEPLACVVHGMDGLAVKKGQSALVIGAGPIGLLHLLLLKAKGLKATVCDTNGGRLIAANKLGARTLSASSLSSAMQFDYLFECTGRPEVWERGVDYLRRGGTLILFGGCPSGTKVTYDAARLHYDELTLKGVFHFTPANVKEAYGLLSGGKVRVKDLISGSCPLKDIEKAFGRLSKGEGIKYEITP